MLSKRILSAAMVVQIGLSVEEFISEANLKPNFPRVEWIKPPHMEVYCRHTWRYLLHEKVEVFDIATVGVHPKWQGAGLYTTFINKVVELSPWPYIYFENCQNDRLAQWHRRLGHSEVSDTQPSCFYLKVEDARQGGIIRRSKPVNLVST